MQVLVFSWFVLLHVVFARRDTTVQRNTRDEDVVKLVNEMRSMDSNGTSSARVVQVDLQGHTSSRGNNDAARFPLFKKVDQSLLRGKTYTAFMALLNNYNPMTGIKEVNTRAEGQEVDKFLDTMLSTGIMQKVQRFLGDKGYAPARSDREFRQKLIELWFDNYSRKRGVADTSGFEHVFVGEWKDGVQGIHSWVQYYLLEKAGQLDYKGFILKRQDRSRFPIFVMIRYQWGQRKKPSGSFFIGTSPEFDFALYTLCYVAKPGYSACKFELDGQKFSITTFESVQNGKSHIGSAFPSPRRR